MSFSINLKTGLMVPTPRSEPTEGGDLHKINCPFCEMGFAMVFVQKNLNRDNCGEMSVDLGEVRTCTKCGGHFKLRYKMKLYGVALDNAKGMPYASPYHPRRS